MKIPKCCGRDMQVSMELSRFMEVRCSRCGDVIYVKREDIKLPQLIDD